MRSRAASLLGMVLVASTLVGAEAKGAAASENERVRAPSGKVVKPPAPAEGQRRDPSKLDSEEEIIKHLDQIENLELLQNLELFDTAGKRK